MWAQTGWLGSINVQECFLKDSADLTTPSPPSAVASRHFIDGASPLLLKEGNLQREWGPRSISLLQSPSVDPCWRVSAPDSIDQ